MSAMNQNLQKPIIQFAFNTQMLFLLVFVLALPASARNLSDSSAQVVRAVLFYSPSCGHCHKVIEQDLPPIVDKYGTQLEIILINITTPEGSQLFQSAAEYFKDVREIRGVPTLVIGEQILIGSLEIPEQFPDIIDAGLAQGGIDWPTIPGLSEVLQSQSTPEPTANSQPSATETERVDEALSVLETTPEPQSLGSPLPSESPLFIQKYLQDPTGNTIAVITLIGMIISVIIVGYYFLRPVDETAPVSLPRWLTWPAWVTPTICIIGFGVAGYMSYVELTHTEAICGPLGDCNSVQQSPYATLWGFLPVGVLGMIGYVSVGIVWVIHRYSRPGFRKLLSLALWGMALLGTLFSIYLTFLEPFVIGATCVWCISSAILITLLLWATTEPALQAMALEDKSAVFDY